MSKRRPSMSRENGVQTIIVRYFYERKIMLHLNTASTRYPQRKSKENCALFPHESKQHGECSLPLKWTCFGFIKDPNSMFLSDAKTWMDRCTIFNEATTAFTMSTYLEPSRRHQACRRSISNPALFPTP